MSAWLLVLGLWLALALFCMCVSRALDALAWRLKRKETKRSWL